MELTALEGNIATGFQCLLPHHYKEKSSVIDQYLILLNFDPEEHHISEIFYLQTLLAPEFGKYIYKFFISTDTKIIPDNTKPLSWRYDETSPLVEVTTSVPNKSWALMIGEKIAAGICIGMLPLTAKKDEKIQKEWEEKINTTIDFLVGLYNKDHELSEG